MCNLHYITMLNISGKILETKNILEIFFIQHIWPSFILTGLRIQNKHMCNLHYITMLNISGKILETKNILEIFFIQHIWPSFILTGLRIQNKHMCNLHYITMLNIAGKILKSVILNVDFESLNYCIPRRHRLLDQTTKQPLSNFEPIRPWKYKQLRELRPGHSCL